ncbi:GM21279 [Drosophila sechellia]|uniref:GM21279 n=1 Tax=Drosophila sechellia TaxID=7238 RepID=B4IJX5_DROSE|nr:GM21279 [Drosophila sechellia]
MDMQLQRPITSGSRQAPDPYDQYLESRGLYRKHTARDASSLFRVIAEQMYDTQMLHYEIRLECVRFMTLKRRIFEKEIPGDFDSYMQDMSKPKTYGTMTELRAMSCLYRRNVILYEPFNMGTSVIFNRRYAENFRVFFNNENHFDSVYDVEYIERAAICQSIAFKLLYQKLFKLPDVSFAVEIMLHPHTFNWDRFNVEFDDKGYMVGAKCKVELPHETEMYTCHVQNISKDKKYGLIFVETIGKKIVVPYESLHPMPPEEYRPWSLPYRYHRQMPRMPLPKFAGKANKSAKWKKSKLFEIEYFESSKCDLIAMQGYMPAENCYHQDVHIQDDEQREHRDPEQNDQNPATEQRDREEPHAQQQHQRTKASRVQPQNSSSSQNQECSGSAAPPPPTQYMNYVPMIPSRPGHLPPPWPASPIALAEEFQFPISGTPHPPPTEVVFICHSVVMLHHHRELLLYRDRIHLCRFLLHR